ncbi:ferredoxin reductase-like protein [Aspergillus costaricaensis CBS 115574]|uniref:Ferredoxin reductase-like protein n=1 Tax=Aspergillus costaricaensis CBS 115574 TaxID=1448317 RepID=A0ACD1IN41_9EURO|nr:ferredoxin reductase-like protein [Aspergillus costaricaensis CBS 115574]RAK91172.1 ferredoxin reductase-like protein [Aspergillus costaricaensis CBS 115574]
MLPSTRITRILVASFTVAGCGVYSFKRHLIEEALAETPEQEPHVMFRGFRPTSLRVQNVESLSHNTKRLRFEYPDQTWISGLQLTSSVLVFCWPQKSWFPAIRPYTPVSSLNQRGFLDLVVKKYPHGKVSSHLHTLQPGDSLYFLGHLPGGYRWSAATANEHSRVYLIAGGSGITPTYQLARGILEDNPNANTKVQVVFGANTAQDLVLKKELDILQQRFADRLQMHYLVSEAGPSTGEADNKDVSYGARVNTSRLRQLFGVRREGDEKVFVCGPPGMEKALVGGKSCGRGILEELGFQKDQVHIF